VDIWYTGEIFRALVRHTGVRDELDLYRHLGIDRILWFWAKYRGRKRKRPEKGVKVNHWGCLTRRVRAGGALYDEHSAHPLEGFDTPESLEDYPWWPSPEKFDYAAMSEKADRAGDEFAVMGPWVSLFEIYCAMRGLERALMDVLVSPRLVNAALDRIESIQTEMLERFLAQAAAKLDMVFVSDDMGAQNGLLISLESWRDMLAPRLKRLCDLIHGYGLRVFYHSDGAIAPLVPHLIETGIDVLNPIQHACKGMEMEDLKSKYGDRLIFHGGVDNQFVLSRGTAGQVREETRACLKTLGRGGGFICCSCHNVQPGTPVENVLAMIETVHKEGALTW